LKERTQQRVQRLPESNLILQAGFVVDAEKSGKVRLRSFERSGELPLVAQSPTFRNLAN
jgi:hypothetical protein